VGDRWSLLILGAAFQGCVRFGDWRRAIGIASNVLTNRLNQLVELGCLEKRLGDDARGFEYHLTPMGIDLYPTALMFWRFDQLWSEPQLLHPEALNHRACGQALSPVIVCSACREDVHPRDVRYEDGPGAGTEEAPPPRVSRRSSVTLGESGARHATLFGESVDRLGDRWTQMVIASIFLGAERFDEIQRECGIAPNILSVRLKELVDGDLLLRRRYQTGPERFEYVLTPKGMDMYPIALTLMTWGDHWMATRAGAPLLLTHFSCGAPLTPVVVCEACGATPSPRDVTFGSVPGS
jgi:DNA-binding HxlR family transcriptional regulator